MANNNLDNKKTNIINIINSFGDKVNNDVFLTNLKIDTAKNNILPVNAEDIVGKLSDEEYKSYVKQALVKDDTTKTGTTDFGIAYFEDKDINLVNKQQDNLIKINFYSWLYDNYYAPDNKSMRRHINTIFPELEQWMLKNLKEKLEHIPEYVKVNHLKSIDTPKDLILEYLTTKEGLKLSSYGLQDSILNVNKISTRKQNTVATKTKTSKLKTEIGLSRLPLHGLTYNKDKTSFVEKIKK